MPDMRFAPPPAMRVTDRGGGLNQMSVRTYNERLVMSLLRQHGQLSRMELGQKSGLSAQTVSVIVRALERDGLILAGAAQRGRVGPPSIPMSLNPEGAFAIGVKLGTKSLDTVLIDFLGDARRQVEVRYDHPEPHLVLDALSTSIPEVAAALSADQAPRLVGVGIGLPHGLESWPLPDWKAGAPGWSGIDFEALSRSLIDLPAYIQNDVTAAASAEMIFGTARTMSDFAYFFVGTGVESRVVLNHRIYAGRRQFRRADESSTHEVSLLDLERRLAAAGIEPSAIWKSPNLWPEFVPVEAEWIEATAAGLTSAISSILGFLDLTQVVIDGRFPARVRETLCMAIREELACGPLAGAGLEITPGHVGALAKSVGAASLAFHSRFMIEEVGLAPG